MNTPLFQPLTKRAAGVLLHITSLPSATGIGTLGKEAYRFIDFLKAANFTYWQVLPIGPTGFGDSPYQSFSSFAGNPYLIDLEALCQSGLLTEEILKPLRTLPHAQVDYDSLYQNFWPIIQTAFNRYITNPKAFPDYQDFETFKIQQAYWLEPYSLFMSLKSHFNPKLWSEWAEPFNHYEGARKQLNASRFKEIQEIELYSFIQYLFFKQWSQLKIYAAHNQIKIIGDIPLFVALDSADVWQHPEYFELDAHRQPIHVAGVPPDYFSENGQVWGNPLHNWNALKATGYEWWIKRLQTHFCLFDSVRIDHFRGLESYWQIPFGAKTAKIGEWITGPGIELFKALKPTCPTTACLIAENLGTLTPAVQTLLDAIGIPGMAILQFAFDGDSTNPYLPHNLHSNQVVYSGVHDNDTSLGWYRTVPSATQDYFRRYFRVSGTEAPWDMIRAAYQSVSNLAIIPMQDLLSLGSESRMNRPSAHEGNWQWRLTNTQLNQVWQESGVYLKSIANTYGRT
jgi:4-alpha-glucanotransferase